MNRDQIDELIDKTLMERAAEFRKKGVVELIIGGLVLIVPAIILLAMYLADVELTRGVIFLAVLCYAGLLYGLYRCAKGGWWLLRGAKSEGSVTDD